MRMSWATDRAGLYREALRLLRPFWTLTFCATAMGGLSGGATVWLLAIINREIQAGTRTLPFFLSFAGLCALTLISGAAAGIGNSLVGQRLVAALRKDISARILCAPIAALERARLHRLMPRVKAAFHTHMPNATALCLLEGPPLLWLGQTALKFYGRTAVDEHYNGLALDESEGDRIAAAMGDADILFLKNHGVMVAGASIAEAWDDLYYLERAAEVQLKAMSSNRALKPVPHDVAQRAYEQMRLGDKESARAHLDSSIRELHRRGITFDK